MRRDHAEPLPRNFLIIKDLGGRTHNYLIISNLDRDTGTK